MPNNAGFSIVVSGEGKSDFGTLYAGEISHGPMLLIVKKILEKKGLFCHPDLVSESDLIKTSQKYREQNRKRILLPSWKSKKGYPDFSANARALGWYAVDNSHSAAVFFRDADKSNSTERDARNHAVESIKHGFAVAGYETGVPMMPLPCSEAWVLALLKPIEQHVKLEVTAKSNDKSENNLKNILEKEHKICCTEDLNETVEKYFKIDNIKTPSYEEFLDDFNYAVNKALQ